MPFDIGFLELIIIAVVALVVIGPERLPEVARTAGKWFGKLSRFVNNVKDDINRELKAEELKETLRKQADVGGIHEILENSRSSMSEIQDETRDALDNINLNPDNKPDAEKLKDSKAVDKND